MAVKQILVGKNGCSAAGLTLIQGDADTQIIQMIVQRYYGGVDLGGLTWDVVFENAEGKSDVHYLTDIKVGDVNISCNWKPHGLATQAAGMTKFQLEGYAEDNSGATAMVWQSGAYYFNITDDMNYVPGEGENEALTDVHKLIMYVDKELPGVIQAGEDAATAAQAANAAAAEANAATAQAVPAAEAANSAAASAANAADSANAASARANTAAEGAEQARDNIQEDLNQLSEEIASMFCEIGEYYKVDLLSKYNLYQGSINADLSIDETRMDRVVYRVPLKKNKIYYFVYEPFTVVDCILSKAGYTSINPEITAKGMTIATDGVERELLVSLRRVDNSELMVSEPLLDDCHLYEMVEKAKISTNGMLQQGYFSFTNKTYVDSEARVCMQCDLEPGKVYSVVAPDNVVLREISLYKNENEVYSLFTAAALKRAIVRVSEYEPDKNKMQIIFSRNDSNAAISVDDCEKVELTEVY